jgi:isopenicillin N synthase-like dioxygenase
LARLFALALGLDMTYFDQPGFFDNPTCLLGMNYYHFRSGIWKEGEGFGIKPHMDSGIFTLLLTDGSEGLERCVNRKVRRIALPYHI